MQVKIAVRHGQLGEETQQRIREKAEKLLHFFDRLTIIEVTVDLKKTEGDRCLVELLVQAEHRHDFVAREHHHDPVAALDMALNKLESQLRRYKEKIQDRRRRPSTGEAAGAPSPEESGEL